MTDDPVDPHTLPPDDVRQRLQHAALALADLAPGLGPLGLAAALRRQGARGTPGDCERCVLAVWLARAAGLTCVSVEDREGGWVLLAPSEGGMWPYLWLPAVAGRLAEMFDAGEMPYLEEPQP